MPSRQPVVVVGAGIAGLACARAMADAGLAVRVLEQDRSVGGRMATRRVQGQPVDHGAQYVTASDPGFEALLRRLAATGLAEPWATELHRYERGHIKPGGARETGRVRWAFPDGMSTLARHLAADLDVRRQARVTGLARAQRGWLVTTAAGAEQPARAVVLAVPAPRAVPLLDAVPGLAELAGAASSVRYDPCWVLAAGYPAAPPPVWRGVFVEDDPAVAWVCHDSSKRHGPPATALVTHATGGWTSDRLDRDPARVEADLVAATVRVVGRWAAVPAWAVVHCWREAQLARGVDDPWLLAAGHAPIGLCGDWCAGPKVEGAWRSGHGLGAALAERLA